MLALAAVLAVAKGFGVFRNTNFIGQTLTPVQIFILTCGIFLPPAAFFYSCGAYGIVTTRLCKLWPASRGVVSAVEIKTDRQLQTGPTYRFLITYRYAVGGLEYVGERVTFASPRASDDTMLKRLTETYRVGTEILVRYDPNEPQNAILNISEDDVQSFAQFDFGRAYVCLIAPFAFGLIAAVVGIFN